MCGQTEYFGGVSCVNKYPNPIKICRQLILNQYNSADKKWILPQYLSGDGINEFIKNTTNLKNYNEIKSSFYAIQNYNKLKKIYKQTLNADEELKMDTVGAICVDLNGDMTVGASSGGIPLRHKGRIGHVSLPSGSGIWISQNQIACCVSGRGEQLAKLNLSRKLVESISLNDNFESESIINLQSTSPPISTTPSTSTTPPTFTTLPTSTTPPTFTFTTLLGVQVFEILENF